MRTWRGKRRQREPGRLLAFAFGAVAAFAGVANLAHTDSMDAILGNANVLALAVVIPAVALTIGFRVGTSTVTRAAGITIALVMVTTAFAVPKASEARLKVILFATTVPLLYVGGQRLLASPSAQRAFLWALAVLAVGTAAGLILLGSSEDIGRVSFDGGDSIAQARVCAIGASIAFVAFVRRTGIARLLALATVAFTMLGLASTGSRGPFAVVLLAVLVVLLFGQSHRRSVQFLLAAATAGLGLTLLVATGSEGGVGRILGDNTQASDTQRASILRGTIDTASQNPLGVGLGNLYRYLSPGELVPGLDVRQYPHNVVVEMFAEGGLFAGVAFVATLILSALALRPLAHSVRGQMLISVWVVGVGSAMTSSDLTGNRLMWLVIGMSAAIGANPSRDSGGTGEVDPLTEQQLAAGEASGRTSAP